MFSRWPEERARLRQTGRITILLSCGPNRPGRSTSLDPWGDADHFDTGREALDAMMAVIEKDGIRSFLEGDSEEMQ